MPAWPWRERDLGDRDRELQRDVAHLRERRVEAALREIVRRHLRGERLRRGEEHLVGDALRADRHRAEADAGEDVGVVALARDPGARADRHRDRTGCRRRTAPVRRSTRTPARRCIPTFDVGFDSAKTIGRWLRRVISSTTGRVKLPPVAETPISVGRLERADRRDEVGLARVLVRVRQLVLGELAAARGDDQPLRVEQPARAPRLRRIGALGDHRRDDEIGDAGRRLAGAEKEQALAVERLAGDAQRRVDAGERDRGGALDVVVERADAVAVLLQQAERVVVGEVLELDDDAGEDRARRGDELVDAARRRRRRSGAAAPGRGRADRRAAPGCWCRRRASPAGTASDGRRRRPCRARACRPGSPCRSSRGRRGRGCARRR